MRIEVTRSKRLIVLLISLFLMVLMAMGFFIANARHRPAQTRCPNPVDAVACKSGQVPSVNKCTCYAPMKLNASCQCK
jgi:hypothetical protein